MRYLTVSELFFLHRKIIETTGGSYGLRDLGALESAAAQPRATFGSADLHATLAQKVAALAFSIVQNHPFLDGNKRLGHAAMEAFLLRNGYELVADTDEQESLMLSIASGASTRELLARWCAQHIRKIE
jgi:death on curing protein